MGGEREWWQDIGVLMGRDRLLGEDGCKEQACMASVLSCFFNLPWQKKLTLHRHINK